MVRNNGSCEYDVCCLWWWHTSAPNKCMTSSPTVSVFVSLSLNCNSIVEKRLVVGFCGHPHYCNSPYHLAAKFWSSLSHIVSAVCQCRQLHTLNCIVAICHLKFEGRLQSVHDVRDGTRLTENHCGYSAYKVNEATFWRWIMRCIEE